MHQAIVYTDVTAHISGLSDPSATLFQEIHHASQNLPSDALDLQYLQLDLSFHFIIFSLKVCVMVTKPVSN